MWFRYGPAPGLETEDVPALTHGLSDGDTFTLGAMGITAIHTPCHTRGHLMCVVRPALARSTVHDPPPPTNTHRRGLTLSAWPSPRYFVERRGHAPVLFSGDMLFAGGCGALWCVVRALLRLLRR